MQTFGQASLHLSAQGDTACPRQIVLLTGRYHLIWTRRYDSNSGDAHFKYFLGGGLWKRFFWGLAEMGASIL